MRLPGAGTALKLTRADSLPAGAGLPATLTCGGPLAPLRQTTPQRKGGAAVMMIFPVWMRVYLTAVTAVFGLVLGSGLGCLADRMARGESWARGRSHCDSCGHTLAAADLVPVFSWLFLRGRCRYCGARIGAESTLRELLLAALLAAVLWRFGPTAEALAAMVLLCCLFCLSIVDAKTLLIPNRFLVIAAAARVVWLLAFGGGAFALLRALATGAVLAGVILLLALLLDRVLKKESMGGGDLKLLAVLGLYFTPWECLLLLILSCLAALVFALLRPRLRNAAGELPFGPFLSAAAALTLLIGAPVTGWYLSFFL